jgi:hypothetical protein
MKCYIRPIGNHKRRKDVLSGRAPSTLTLGFGFAGGFGFADAKVAGTSDLAHAANGFAFVELLVELAFEEVIVELALEEVIVELAPLTLSPEDGYIRPIGNHKM